MKLFDAGSDSQLQCFKIRVSTLSVAHAGVYHFCIISQLINLLCYKIINVYLYNNKNFNIYLIYM